MCCLKLLRRAGRLATAGVAVLATVVLIAGPLQVILTGGVGFGVGSAFGLEAAEAAVLGMLVALSSTAVVLKTMTEGGTVDTPRGRLFFREIDNQLSCSTYFGKVADDPKYPFPIYHDLLELKAPDNWRPEAEILAARKK